MHAITALPTSSDRPNRFNIDAHPVHQRLRHVTIDKCAVTDFLAEVASVDVQNLEYVPFMRFVIAERLAANVGDDFTHAIRRLVMDREIGGFTMGVEGTTTDSADFVKFGTAVAHLLGPGNHDSMSDSFYARFIVQDTDASDSYLRQAYRLFTLHTDGTFVDEATDWLLMMKFAEDCATGGESRIMHLDDWSDRDRFREHPLATQPMTYKAPSSKNVDRLVERPVFFESDFGLSLSFIDQFVQPRNADEARYLHELSESMECSPGTKEIPIPVGDVIVLNNYFWLHGRAPFQKHPALYRELMRQRGRFAS